MKLPLLLRFNYCIIGISICSPLHIIKVVHLILSLTIIAFKMFGARHYMYYTNRSVASKVDSTYLGC